MSKGERNMKIERSGTLVTCGACVLKYECFHKFQRGIFFDSWL
jgi:hypothetical protein